MGAGGKQSSVLSSEMFGPIKQIIRLDLAFVALTNNSIAGIDDASFLEKYTIWNNQFKPDSAIEAFR